MAKAKSCAIWWRCRQERQEGTIRDAAQISLFKAIRAILLKHWDPIGITETGGPAGEYDSYVWPIVRMVRQAATPENIADYLLEIERGSIGLPGDEVRSGVVGRMIAALGRDDAH